jgi:hypothetical protein
VHALEVWQEQPSYYWTLGFNPGNSRRELAAVKGAAVISIQRYLRGFRLLNNTFLLMVHSDSKHLMVAKEVLEIPRGWGCSGQDAWIWVLLLKAQGGDVRVNTLASGVILPSGPAGKPACYLLPLKVPLVASPSFVACLEKAATGTFRGNRRSNNNNSNSCSNSWRCQTPSTVAGAIK